MIAWLKWAAGWTAAALAVTLLVKTGTLLYAVFIVNIGFGMVGFAMVLLLAIIDPLMLWKESWRKG